MVCLAGVDEVGRGCLAGPVVAAAVILSSNIDGLADSKQLTPRVRERLALEIRSRSLAFGIGVIGQRMVDRINILQATFMAMSIAVARLSVAPAILMVDGKFCIPNAVLQRFWIKHNKDKLPHQKAVIGGDASVAAISAASILAKTYRDAMMQEFALRWPLYGFEKHVGYGTKMHRMQIERHGSCPLHRQSFKGVCQKKSEVLSPTLLSFSDET